MKIFFAIAILLVAGAMAAPQAATIAKGVATALATEAASNAIKAVGTELKKAVPSTVLAGANLIARYL